VPIYQYQCQNGHITEELSKVRDSFPTIQCRECKGIATRILSPTPTTFKQNDRKAIKGKK
jgi:putative FmdB family regulatory protein